MVGVDLQPSQVAQAQALSAARGVKNVRFEVADVYRLPFADGSFDAVFAHVVLMHLREPVRALKEMRRVLRPGGIVGVRDTDWGGRIHAPMTPLLEQWYATYCTGPGAQWRQSLHGPSSPPATARCRICADSGERVCLECGNTGGNPKPNSFFKAAVQGLGPTALAEGWIDQTTLDAVQAEFDAWAVRPDAFYVETFCEALGWVSD